ncbi:MAG TPA: sulfate adenylyltransferase [Phycisphaerae bacterium]|jgi:sulfate adenylyltransferase|nr:sulfate adenylyltransferase [Phycisphaerae bacterium]HOB72924.1 sulfate adenylyltransferase [Phycisphaerae bacterium]HOJ53027.1 sulfate adenylyltransferase [Phycisphaerae bacterium]HOL24764.1 sulfate adenylyltransferase [Phycisphaerae bacterium]HPP19300.1 sulfate adenylyltransferase [Phycisphaerae bacterium]
MPDLIPPHGGLTEPMNRTVPADRQAQFKREAAGLPALVVSDADLSSVYRIGDGGLSPLVGPMIKPVYDQVLREASLTRNGRKYAWTIPISLPATSEEAGSMRPGQRVRLVNSAGETVGILTVEDIFPWDKAAYIEGVYQTKRTDHPGARMVLTDPREMLVGGEIEVLPQPKHPEYGKYVLTPRETRALFASKGWERVVAFQTRNPLHRAHEYALVHGAEVLTREGYKTGVVLNPLIGETKSDDVNAATRMRTYEALIQTKQLGQGDKDEELWKSKGYDLLDVTLLLGLDIKMFYGGPKEAIMHAIYRQNFGFTDIIIGRKHADAPYDDGTDIWDPLAAQRIFDEITGELLIKPVKVGFAAYYEELGRVGLVDECSKKGWKPIPISGRDVREALAAGRLPDPRVMRESTARILIEAMKK